MTWFRIAVALGVLTLAFSYHGPGWPFAWAVGVLVAVAMSAPPIVAGPRSDFAAFWVRIWPTRELLTETGLATDEEVKALENDTAFGWHWNRPVNRPQTPSEHSFLRDGIWFTVLKLDNFDQTGLVFWNPFKTFTTAVEMELDLAELARPMGPGAAIPSTLFNPRLDLKPVAGGLSLRIATVGEILHSDEGIDPGKVVTVLPWATFLGYGWWQNQEKTTEQRTAQLKACGWTKERNELAHLGAPDELKHKFFTVQWGYI